MGLSIGVSKSSFDDGIDGKRWRGFSCDCPPQIVTPNPNPERYGLMDYFSEGHSFAIKLRYEGCTNYEGIKILVFNNTSLSEVIKKNKNKIDPHFSDNKNFISPIARFEPTSFGWTLAQNLVRKLNEK